MLYKKFFCFDKKTNSFWETLGCCQIKFCAYVIYEWYLKVTPTKPPSVKVASEKPPPVKTPPEKTVKLSKPDLLNCPLCNHTSDETSKLQEHVNREHFDENPTSTKTLEDAKGQ